MHFGIDWSVKYKKKMLGKQVWLNSHFYWIFEFNWDGEENICNWNDHWSVSWNILIRTLDGLATLDKRTAILKKKPLLNAIIISFNLLKGREIQYFERVSIHLYNVWKIYEILAKKLKPAKNVR